MLSERKREETQKWLLQYKILSFKFLEYLLLFFVSVCIIVMIPFIVIIDYLNDFRNYIIEDYQKSIDILVNQPTLTNEEMIEFGNKVIDYAKSLEN